VVDVPALENYYNQNNTAKSATPTPTNPWQEIAFKRAATKRQTGFIAQDVEQLAKATGYDFSGIDVPMDSRALYGLRYADFVVPLVKAVQEQQAIIETLQKQVEAAKAEIPLQIGKQQAIIEEQNKKIELLLKEIQLIKDKLK